MSVYVCLFNVHGPPNYRHAEDDVDDDDSIYRLFISQLHQNTSSLAHCTLVEALTAASWSHLHHYHWWLIYSTHESTRCTMFLFLLLLWCLCIVAVFYLHYWSHLGGHICVDCLVCRVKVMVVIVIPLLL